MERHGPLLVVGNNVEKKQSFLNHHHVINKVKGINSVFVDLVFFCPINLFTWMGVLIRNFVSERKFYDHFFSAP